MRDGGHAHTSLVLQWIVDHLGATKTCICKVEWTHSRVAGVGVKLGSISVIEIRGVREVFGTISAPMS